MGKKKLLFLSLFILFIFGLAIDTEAAEPQKGDMRCPVVEGIDQEPNVSCREVKSNGVVTEVVITYGEVKKKGDVQIVKHVSKTNELGKYSVYFEVKGDIDQVEVPEKGYVSVLIDMSYTISGNVGKVIEASKKFASTLIPNGSGGNYYISLHQFAQNNKKRRSLDNKDFSNVTFFGYNTNGLGKKSFVDKAFKAAYDELKNVTGKKFVVLIGDGYYWYTRDTGVGDAKTYANKLRNELGVTFYVIRYASREDGENNNWRAQANNAGCYKEKKWVCNQKMMSFFMCGNNGRNCEMYKKNFKEGSDWTSLLEGFAKDVKENTNGQIVTSELRDKIGSSFYLEDEDAGRYQNFDIGEITKDGLKTSPFSITIDDYAKDGWHETNENVTLSYTYKNEEGNAVQKKINISKSPEVYWIQPRLDFSGCIGDNEMSSRTSDSDEFKYWKKNCVEGYLNNNRSSASGYKVSLNMKKYNMDKKQYEYLTASEKKGFETNNLGFMVEANISTNVRCTYTFDFKTYKEDWDSFSEYINDLKTMIANKDYDPDSDMSIEDQEKYTKDQIIIYEQELEDMKQSLKNYLSLLNEDLATYRDTFEKQNARVIVSYNNNKTKEINLQSTNFKYSLPNPSLTTTAIGNSEIAKIVGSNNLITKKVATLSMSKTLIFPASCLSMQNGEQEDCNNENNQLNSGNIFYPPFTVKSGKIQVILEDAGIRNNLKFTLKGDDCQFTQNKATFDSNTSMYRQISVSDPFIKELNPSRLIGRNYLNDKYNFVKVISADLWDTDTSGNLKHDYEYYYEFGKENVAKIRADSSEEGKTSYLGRNCKFTSNNSDEIPKYVCLFVRDSSENGLGTSNGWFSKIRVNR